MPPVTSEESTSYEVRMATTSETPYRVIVPALADRNLASFTGRGQQSQVTVGVPFVLYFCCNILSITVKWRGLI